MGRVAVSVSLGSLGKSGFKYGFKVALKGSDVEEIEAKNNRQNDELIKIVSPTIDKKSKVRKVNVVVDAKKGIKVNKQRLGIKNNIVSIANPTIENGSKVKEINIMVDAKHGGIQVK